MTLMIFAAVVTTIIVINDHNTANNIQKNINDIKISSEKAVSDAEEREEIAQYKRAELKAMLDPFIKIAERKYPGTDTNLALSKLARDIEEVKEEVKELAARDIYHPLTNDKKQELLNILKTLCKRHQLSLPEIKLCIQQGNKNRNRVCEDFVNYLTLSGFRAKIESRGLFPHTDPESGFEIHTNSKYKRFVYELISALKIWLEFKIGVAVRDSEAWKKRGTFPDDEIQIYAYVNPLFDSKGVVKD